MKNLCCILNPAFICIDCWIDKCVTHYNEETGALDRCPIKADPLYPFHRWRYYKQWINDKPKETT